MRHIFLISSLCICVFGTVNANAETIDGAVSKSLQTHPSVSAAQAALGIARNQRKEFQSNYYPVISANTTAGRIFQDNATTRGLTVTRGSAYSYLFDGGISARQMIFDGFETRNRVDSANARKLAADLTLSNTMETLSFNTVQAYVDLLRTQKAIVLLENQVFKTQDYLSRIEQAMQDGAADESEFQRAEDVLYDLQGLLVVYQGQMAAAQTQYIELVGEQPDSDLENPMPDMSFIQGGVEDAVMFASQNHPSIKAAKLSVKSAAYDIAVEKAGIYPDINGELSYQQADKVEEIGGELQDARAVVRMNWDFETGMAHKARVNQSKNRYNETEARLEEIRLQIAKGVRLAYAEYDTALKLLQNNTERAMLADDLYNTYTVQFEGALVRLIDLALADFQLFRSLLDQNDAAHRALTAQYAMLASTGYLRQSLNIADTDNFITANGDQ